MAMARARSLEEEARVPREEVVTPPRASMSSPGRLRLHRDHAFGGMEIVESAVPRAIVARCECGVALDVAEAVFGVCPECSNEGSGCRRCAGTREIVDHAALEWQRPEEWRERHGDPA
jgi:hypothetical protein